MNRLAAHLIHFSSLAHSAARNFVQDEDGVTVVEIILVLVGIHTTPLPIVLC